MALFSNVQKFYLKIKNKILWQQLQAGPLRSVPFRASDSVRLVPNAFAFVMLARIDARFSMPISLLASIGQLGGFSWGLGRCFTIEIWQRQIIGFSLSALKMRQTV